MIYLLIGISLVVVLVIISITKIENYNTPISAPWIRKKTPLPVDYGTLESSLEIKLLIDKSVDPGAHLECQKWCESKGKSKRPEFMQVCIDTCMQEKWTKDDSLLKVFKP